MSLDAIMWLIVLFGGMFTLIAIGAGALKLSFQVDLWLSRLNTPPTLDLMLINSCILVPVGVYCYFWYTVAMSLAEKL